LELDPELAEAYTYRGLIYQQKRDWDRAIADYTRALELKPKDAEIYFNRGLAYSRKYNFHQAIVNFT
jgi:tetratricopeptide (TPR) repeat protein